MKEMLEFIKVLGSIGGILVVIMGAVSYLLNAPYFSYINKMIGVPKYNKKQSVVCFLLISNIYILGIIIINIDVEIINKILNLILGSKQEQRVSRYLLYTTVLLCFFIYESYSLENIGKIINKKRHKNVYWFEGLGILVINSIINSFTITNNVIKNQDDFYLVIIIIINLLNFFINILMYGIFVCKENLNSLKVSKIYFKSDTKEPYAEGKVLYANDKEVCIYNANKRTCINRSEVLKIEFD